MPPVESPQKNRLNSSKISLQSPLLSNWSKLSIPELDKVLRDAGTDHHSLDNVPTRYVKLLNILIRGAGLHKTADKIEAVEAHPDLVKVHENYDGNHERRKDMNALIRDSIFDLVSSTIFFH